MLAAFVLFYSVYNQPNSFWQQHLIAVGICFVNVSSFRDPVKLADGDRPAHLWEKTSVS